MQERFPKYYWKLFRTKLPDWQEAYMDKPNQEYIQLLNGGDSPSEKFWHLDKRIKADKRSPGVQLQMSQTDLFYSFLALLNDGVISLDDLRDFSEELRDNSRTIQIKSSPRLSYTRCGGGLPAAGLPSSRCEARGADGGIRLRQDHYLPGQLHRQYGGKRFLYFVRPGHELKLV